AELDRRMTTGMTVKKTSLSKEFTLDDFHKYYGQDAVILFVQRGGVTTVAHQSMKLPRTEGSLIAMVYARDNAVTGSEPGSEPRSDDEEAEGAAPLG
ncbi:MAG: hypothetical protein L0H59_16590, partial [Tomitella sp.]|nr:hypothetical protein [Tomitella sp.]